ncbi:MAG: L-lactate dehydrogenase [Alphaproteobacteria bacterium]|nr:L-lactate dehydrogenase [Alphaproteobacteria bacterium]
MKKITVIGAGLVGATSVYSLMLREIADEIALVDVDDKRANAEVWDIRHGFPELSKTIVKKGTYADCQDSDVIVITAGVARKVGESRNDLLLKNSKIMESICTEIKNTGTNAIVIVVSNPVDVLANHVAKFLQMPKGRVFGTGCTLDTSRMVALLADKLNKPTSAIIAPVVGEHGDEQIVLWDEVTVDGKHVDFSPAEKQEFAEAVKKAGMTIIEGKGKTYYGIATTVCALATAVLLDRPAKYAVSVPDENSDKALSMVCTIAGQGIVETFPYK